MKGNTYDFADPLDDALVLAVDIIDVVAWAADCDAV